MIIPLGTANHFHLFHSYCPCVGHGRAWRGTRSVSRVQPLRATRGRFKEHPHPPTPFRPPKPTPAEQQFFRLPFQKRPNLQQRFWWCFPVLRTAMPS